MRFDLGLILSILILIAWAVGALLYDGPGWIHILLTGGVGLLIWRIVATSDSSVRRGGKSS
jgi:hypothetical protein